MQKIVLDDKLYQFARRYCDSRCSLGLLMFLARHPHTRFSRLAIVHALDAGRLDVEKAIQYLVNNGLVAMCAAENGLPLYSLTEAEPLRGLVLDLLALDRWQWQLLIEQSAKQDA